MGTTIVPLVVSAVLVAVIAVGLLKLYKKYDGEIEAARLRYNVEGENEFGLDTN